MSTVKPFSAFTDDQAAANYPGLKLYWHQDDVTDGDTTWVDRITGAVLTFSVPLRKDVSGIYTGQTATVTCSALPIPGINTCLVNIFKAATSSATAGGVVTFGSTVEQAGPGISTNGAASQVAAGSVAAATFAATPTGQGKDACRSAALIDSGANAICALAHDDGNSTLAQDTTAASAPLSEFATTVLGSASVTIGSVNAASDDGRRGKVLALFNFTTALTLAELALATQEMARTGELYAGWINRT